MARRAFKTRPLYRIRFAPMRAVQITEFGGPEVLEVADLPVPEPGDHELLLHVSRVGVNFADTHTRENAYLAEQQLPLVLGGEVAGTIEGGVAHGRRVIAMIPSGGYAEYAVVPEHTTFEIPDGVSDEAALALLVQGLTAWHLHRTCAKLQAGESVVVISAAGGVGNLATQLAKPFGAGRVIATASSAEKRRLALELGADAAVDPGEEDLAAALREANEGRRIDVALEMAGGRIFDACLEALAPFGRLVTYGVASREQNEVRTGRLMRRSASVVGFWMAHILGRREMTQDPLDDLFERVGRGELRPVIGPTYPLSDVRRAHEDLQSRRTTGKLTLDPRA